MLVRGFQINTDLENKQIHNLASPIQTFGMR